MLSRALCHFHLGLAVVHRGEFAGDREQVADDMCPAADHYRLQRVHEALGERAQRFVLHQVGAIGRVEVAQVNLAADDTDLGVLLAGGGRIDVNMAFAAENESPTFHVREVDARSGFHLDMLIASTRSHGLCWRIASLEHGPDRRG